MSASDLAGELRVLREAAGLVALPGRGVIEVTGSERVRWLDGMVSQDVKAAAARGPGAGAYALVLTQKGRIVADLHLLALEDALWLELERAAIPGVQAHLDRYIIADDVTLRDASEEIARLAVEGPRAAEAVSDALDGGAGPEPEGFVEARLGGATVRVAAWGFLGEHGRQVFAPAAEAANVEAALLEAGAGAGLAPVGEEAFHVRRVEVGTPWPGHELDESVLPAEARLERAVSTTKGCYTGQEVVARLRSRGRRNHLLVGLRFEGPAPSPGAALEAEGRKAGEVTSVAEPPESGPIGLGFVKAELAEPGTRLALEGGAAVRVCPLPFDDAA
ncbi:MAG: glycine cleavage T C-terminal barrel domain-containing protein [Myxococcota bacterium]|nr:glycine cleavage T C-terminal barrel domain-containing protein [Myxococcota bacterium]